MNVQRQTILGACIALLITPIVAEAGKTPLLPAPDNALTEPLAERLRINGINMRAVRFHVIIEEEKLRAYFVEACARLGGAYTENRLRGDHIQGCITPPYSLTSQWHMENNAAYGTLSSLRMDQEAKPDPLPVDLPLPGSVHILQDVESSDGNIRGRVLHLQVNMPVTKLSASLNKALLAHRWRPRATMHHGGSVISMDKKNRHLDIAISKSGNDKSRLIVVLDQR